MKNYDEVEIVKRLQRKNDVRIHGKQITVLRGSAAKNDLGNGSKGKIDFLCKRGYNLTFTTKF